MSAPSYVPAAAARQGPSPIRPVLALTRYARLGASSRVRFYQYAEHLAAAGVPLTLEPLLDDDYLHARYAGRTAWLPTVRGYLRRFRALREAAAADSLLWIEKELAPWLPAWLELLVVGDRPFVLDLDDAIFHNYDLGASALLRRLYGTKIDRLMRAASVVTVGNEYLAERARRAGARDVRYVPTAVDLRRYEVRHPPETADSPIGIVWIGSPATVHYLAIVAPALQALSRERSVALHVIGGGSFALPGVTVVNLPWSDDTEVRNIQRCDIGIMPLPDSPWERGKCGYKLIQYMACGLPVVASPVGINRDIVRPGCEGYLAARTDEWIQALSALAQDGLLRKRMGEQGRRRVELEYSTRATGPLVVRSLRDASGFDAAATETRQAQS